MSSKNIYIDIFQNKYKDINLTEYFNFIEENKLQKSTKYETANHHILPRWDFPEFESLSKNKWNSAILTHKNHLLAHFLLWKYWRHENNASPLLLMCGKNCEKFDFDMMLNYSDLYHMACKEHAKRVSIRSVGKIISEETKILLRKPRPKSKNMVNVIDVESGNNVYISTNEYRENKELYRHYASGKPSWNSGIPNEKCKNMTAAINIESGEKVYIPVDEFNANKSIYKGLSHGKSNTSTIGHMPVVNLETGETTLIKCEDFNENLHQHTVTGLIWVNNGKKDIRVKPENVPSGFIYGRCANLKSPKKKKECPHCGLIGGGGNMQRYHFDNCKHFQN